MVNSKQRLGGRRDVRDKKIFKTLSDIYGRPEYNFLRPEKLSSRNDVMSDKVNFRPDIRKNLFLKKIRTSEVCFALKVI